MDSEARIEVTIEFDQFITKYDLGSIIDDIDSVVEEYYEWERFGTQPDTYFRPGKRSSELSYVGITGVRSGSATLIVLLGAGVALYVSRHFRRGLSKSTLAAEIERSGILSGTIVAEKLLGPINDRLARYVGKQIDNGGNIRSVDVKLLPPPKSPEE